jgi:HD-GYP domain-containing protein (c-di-GMP phosphodiesterase class II)
MTVQYHERLDGSGYPNGLKADQMIGKARIIAVADVVEAITTHRPYRPGHDLDIGLYDIRQGKGSLYDDDIVDICLELFENAEFVWR